MNMQSTVDRPFIKLHISMFVRPWSVWNHSCGVLVLELRLESHCYTSLCGLLSTRPCERTLIQCKEDSDYLGRLIRRLDVLCLANHTGYTLSALVLVHNAVAKRSSHFFECLLLGFPV